MISAHASNHDFFLEKVSKTIQRHRLLKPEESVLVAVSGGLDSMTLLYALRALGYNLEVAHFDHQTRGGESACDADFVQASCRTLGLPSFQGTEPVLHNAHRLRTSFEAHARERRYAFLTATATRQGIMTLATGHQMDDQAETVLMGLLGLSSDFGPGGLLPSINRDGIKIIRPLIECTREEIQGWALANDIPWREDRSNASTRFMRNRVRLDVIPFLERVHPGFAGRLARFAEMYRCDSAYLDTCASRLLEAISRPSRLFPEIIVLEREAFRLAPDAVRRHAFKVLAHRLGVHACRERLFKAETFVQKASTGAYFDFGDGIRLYAAKDGIHVIPGKCLFLEGAASGCELAVPGITNVGEWTVHARLLAANQSPVLKQPRSSTAWRQYFDLEGLKPPVSLRFRNPGDRMVPFGMQHSKKVQDIMVDEGVPEYCRNALPILTTREGVLWIVGCRRSALAPVREGTRTIVELSCDRVQDEEGYDSPVSTDSL